MKRTKLLNRQLSCLVASLGHLDEIALIDVGASIPEGVKVIDLAVSAGVPKLLDVLDAITDELLIEQAVFVEEASEEFATEIEVRLAHLAADTGQTIDHMRLAQNDLDTRLKQVRAVIRTGEFAPHTNVILVAGRAY